MSCSLHICKTYKVEYAEKSPIHGYSKTDEFVDWLDEQDDFEGFINEERNSIELDVPFIKRHLNDAEYGETMREILENMDKDNNYAMLEIW